MRVLIVYCHPCAESFNAGILDSAKRGLMAAGHELRVFDLYAMGFQPVIDADERRSYHAPGENEAPVSAHLEALRWCEGLIFIYPTWWYGQPAMLKGWLDRVWIPHATFSMPEAGKPIGRKLTNIRLIGAISTLGSPWWWWNLVMFAPGRRVLLMGLKVLAAPRAKTFWLGLHEMDSCDEPRRKRFLARVEAKMAALR